MSSSPPASSVSTGGATPDVHQSLVDLLGDWAAVAPEDYALAGASEVPEPFHGLLVHHRHMTEVLQQHYGVAVHLTVQESEAGAGSYRRRITLSAGSAGPVVELGVVRLNLTVLPEEVQREILAQATPLGRILINHRILRRVQVHHYLRFEKKSAIIKLFGREVPELVYGRVGTIFCNEQPAIELLEIVTGVQRSVS